MIVIPQHLWEQLLANGQAQDGTDHLPVIKFFDPAGAATWLITEVRPDDHDSLFGLCDLGMGFPELGYVSLAELRSVTNRLGIPLERDLFFAARFPLSVYAAAARLVERITENESELEEAARRLAAEKEASPTPPADSPTDG
ncbi:MAG: DUF2958 domain-containing protein [Rhodospirillaceae bacterium]|nr:DUF2958 domain-containing protein [Rhodospirillaceae bacterium]